MSNSGTKSSCVLPEWTESEVQQLVAALTRRKVLSGTVAAGLLTQAGAINAFARQATPTAGFRTIETANGSIEIPTQPTRIVCADYYSPFAVLSAGVTPVGAIEGLEGNLLPEYLDVYAEMTSIGGFGEPDLEEIARLQPDLIVGSADYSGSYEQLSGIAPTALFDFGGSGDWPTFSASIADAIGRMETFETVIHRYRQRAKVFQANYATLLGETRWAIASGADGEWWLYYPNSSHGLVFSEAGVQFIDGIAGQQGDFSAQSYEQIELLADADVIIVRSNSDGSVDEATRALVQHPLFSSLPAAKEGRVYPLSALFPFSYDMATRLLDQIEVVASILQSDF